MSSIFESDHAAAEALASANTADVVAGGVEEQAPPVAAPDAPVETGTTSPEDTFTSIDLDSLPPEAQEAYKNMQGDYTRKTQEIAPLRQALLASGMDVDTARQALEFVQALNDPTNVQALYQRLHSEYGDEGGSGEFPNYEETFGDVEEVDPRDRLLAQVQSRLDQMETRSIETEVKAELDRMEAVVRTGHPEWDDEDLNTVARLAIPYQGDLMRAATDYTALRQRIVGAHISGKAQVPAGATGIGATGHAETPQKFDSLDSAHEAALRLLAADLSN